MDKIALDKLNTRLNKFSTKCYNSYRDVIESRISTNPKLFWSFVKAKKKGSSIYPSTISDGVSTVTGGENICNLFAKYFASVYQRDSASNLSEERCNSLCKSLSKLSNYSLSCSNIEFSVAEVNKSFESLCIDKGAGPDELPPIFISKCASSLALPMCLIYNMSLKSGIFPNTWKTAKVIPIFKSDDDKNASNYRPISIISTFAKVLESLLYPHIYRHFKIFCTEHQHGFIKQRSTCTNLVSFVEKVTESVDKNYQVDVVYTDFSKAFDKICHSVLMIKLSLYGFYGSLLEWIRSYLGDRDFYVVAAGFSSSVRPKINSGVPQGSILGPLLFNIFINDLPDSLAYSTPFLFADDLKILKIIKSVDDSQKMQRDLESVKEWCDLNGMILNIAKCAQMTFSRKLNNIKFNYNIGNINLKIVQTVRDLGVLFDEKLTFVPHVEEITKKSSKMLGFLIRIGKDFKKAETKIMLYNCLVRSILEYCCPVWRPHYAVHTLRLERVQKRFLWHLSYSIGKAKKLSSYSKRLEYFSMQTLSDRRNKLDLLFLHKLLGNDIDCSGLLSQFKLRVPSNYPRKPITPFAPPARRTVLGANSGVARLSKLANQYSDLDIFGDKLSKFKNKLNEILVAKLAKP